MEKLESNRLTQLLENVNKRWLITGVAGFIGSNLLEFLLLNGQKVVGLDNFSTGKRENLEDVKSRVSTSEWDNFTFINGDIRNVDDCLKSCSGVDIVLHQAALGSVPRSIKDPITTNSVNISGFLNVLNAVKEYTDQGQKIRFIFAASSSTYGDHPDLPKVEERIGNPLSPYAVTKYVNELYANIFANIYNIEYIGLRYFNVFGHRQDKEGDYSAVIPQWLGNMLTGNPVIINGDGTTSRDFCFIYNVIQANILAALTNSPDAINQVYNIAIGEATSLNNLYKLMSSVLTESDPTLSVQPPQYRDFRVGDVKHSLADISKAKFLLNYIPSHTISQGMREYIERIISLKSKI